MLEPLPPPLSAAHLGFIRALHGHDPDIAALLAEVDRLQCLCDAAEEAGSSA